VLDDGVLIALGSDPRDWDTPDCGRVEQRIRDHLGPQLFFSKPNFTRSPAKLLIFLHTVPFCSHNTSLIFVLTLA
jgi:hypothetical protein